MTSQKRSFDPRVLAVAAFIVVIIGGSIAGFAYVMAQNRTVYIDKAAISAPVVDLAPSKPDILRNVYVTPGDIVPQNTVVAAVGTELLKSTTGGLVITVNNNIGKLVNPQDTIVEMIDPKELRVVGQVEEDKGFKDIKLGQRAVFTVDAFPGKEFQGVVDEISPTSHEGDVVFNISDKRQTQSFDVKIAFDTETNLGLKNGMSAKIWIYKQ